MVRLLITDFSPALSDDSENVATATTRLELPYAAALAKTACESAQMTVRRRNNFFAGLVA